MFPHLLTTDQAEAVDWLFSRLHPVRFRVTGLDTDGSVRVFVVWRDRVDGVHRCERFTVYPSGFIDDHPSNILGWRGQ